MQVELFGDSICSATKGYERLSMMTTNKCGQHRFRLNNLAAILGRKQCRRDLPRGKIGRQDVLCDKDAVVPQQWKSKDGTINVCPGVVKSIVDDQVQAPWLEVS